MEKTMSAGPLGAWMACRLTLAAAMVVMALSPTFAEGDGVETRVGAVLTGETVVTANNAVFDDNYSGEGGFRFTSGALDEERTLTGYLTTSGVVVADADYRDVRPIAGVIGGPNFSSAVKGTPYPANVFYALDVVNKEATVQFQVLDGTLLKGVIVRVRQDGADARVYAKWDDARLKSDAGASDVGAIDLSSAGHEVFATSDTGSEETGNQAGYGIRDLVLAIRGGTAATRTLDGALPQADKRALEIPNAHVRQVVPVSGLTTGANMGKNRAYAFVNRKDYEGYSTVQAQVEDGLYVKCLRLRFEQSGASVWASVDKTWYIGLDKGVAVGADFETVSGATEAWNTSSSGISGYALTNFAYRLDFARQKPLVTLSGTNTYTGVTTVDGAVLTLGGGYDVLPSDASVVVTNGGELVLNAAIQATASDDINEIGIGGCNAVGRGLTIEVAAGSVLRETAEWNLAEETHVILDGGTFEPMNQYGATYLSNVTLKNGGRIAGGVASGAFRGCCATYAATGSGTNEIASSWNLYRAGNESLVELAVDADATLLMSGQILQGKSETDENVYHGWGRRLRKTGSGTLVLRAVNAHTATNEIAAGTVRLEVSGALTDAMPLLMNGGTLVCGAGTTNEIASLSVGPNGGTLVFEPDAALVLKDYGTLAEDAVLVVRGSVGEGTLKGPPLTPDARRALRYETRRGERRNFARLADGSLIPLAPGLALIIR